MVEFDLEFWAVVSPNGEWWASGSIGAPSRTPSVRSAKLYRSRAAAQGMARSWEQCYGFMNRPAKKNRPTVVVKLTAQLQECPL